MRLMVCVLVMCLGGCNLFSRNASERTDTTQKSVTKTDQTQTVDLLADIPGVGPVALTGSVRHVTFSETVSEEQANAERKETTDVDTAALAGLIRTSIGAALGSVSGGLFGTLATPEGIVLGGSTLAAIAAALMKMRGEAKEKERRQAAEKDATEGWGHYVDANKVPRPPPTKDDSHG